MNEMNAVSEGRFDELTLRIEPRKEGRRIVVCDAGAEIYVSEDGQTYADQAWRIRLYSMRLFTHGQRNMVLLTYRGKHAILGDSFSGRRKLQFDIGKICVSLSNSIRGDGTLGSKISTHLEEYKSVLREEYGIYDGYVFDSPNRAFNVGRFSDYCLLVVSDGEVSCEYNGVELESPTAETLSGICQGNTLSYEVQGATWAVELRWYYDDEDGVPEIRLYTQIDDFLVVLDELEQYLQEQDLTRFDDLLP